MITLSESRLLAIIPPAEVQALERVAIRREFGCGQKVFDQGDAGDGLYIILEGHIRISGLIGEEEPRLLGQLGPGEFFGEMALMDNEPRSAAAVAETDTVVAFFPRDQLMPILEHSPALAMNVCRQFSRRMRDFNQQYLREVLQAERLALVGRFARSIVHDFKNPLAVVGMAAEMMLMDRTTPEMRRTAHRRIMAQVERLGNMANELLEFTRSPNPGHNLVETDYAAFWGTLAEELRQEIAIRAVRLVFEGDLPRCQLRMDPRRLIHVIHNLVNNAVDAMPEGGQITVRFRQSPETIITEIADTGPGIPPEILHRLFEPFATFGKPHGTGLGLSICRRILSDHQGQIDVRNAASGGTVVTITLPLPEGIKQVS